jgi:hypothetical protein
MGKWAAGVAAVVLGSLIVWALTRPGSIFNPSNKTSVSILSISISPSTLFSGQFATATLQLYNDGDLAGEQCRAILSVDGSTAEPGRTEMFGLPKGQTLEVKVQTAVPNDPGIYNLAARVGCLRYGSREMRQQITVVKPLVAQPAIN